MEEAEVSACQFVEPAEDVSVVLDLAYGSLHQVALSVQTLIIWTPTLSLGTRWDARNHPSFSDQLHEPIRVVPLVGYHILSLVSVYQLLGLCYVVSLSTRQRESEWVAISVDIDVDLRAESAPTPTERL